MKNPHLRKFLSNFVVALLLFSNFSQAMFVPAATRASRCVRKKSDAARYKVQEILMATNPTQLKALLAQEAWENSRFETIKSIAMAGLSPDDETLFMEFLIRNLPKFPNLEEATLQFTNGSQWLDALARTPALPKLRILDLQKNYLKDSDMYSIVEIIPPSGILRELHISQNNFGADALQKLAREGAIENLETLSLGSNFLGAWGIKSYEQLARRLSKLKQLNLSDTDKNPGESEAFLEYFAAASSYTPHVKILDLSANSLGENNAIRHLSAVAKAMPQVEKLSLRSNGISTIPDMLYLHESFKFWHSIKELDFAHNFFQRSTLDPKYIFNMVLTHAPHLTSLDLKWNCLGDLDGLADLVRDLAFIRDLNLSELNLGATTLTPAGLEQILRASEHFSLSYLNLYLNYLGDEGMRIFAQGAHNLSQLKYLHLGTNKITSVGLDYLIAVASNLPQLEKINLGGNNLLLKEDILRFKKVFPLCDVCLESGTKFILNRTTATGVWDAELSLSSCFE